jgi:flagellar biogenesis protein FliO
MMAVALVALVLAGWGVADASGDTAVDPDASGPGGGTLSVHRSTSIDQIPEGAETAGELGAIRRTSRRLEGASPAAREGLGAGQVAMALGIVLSVILVLRWAVVRVMAGRAGAGAVGAVQVLSRTVVSPRQHLMLVRVGRRLVVVANTGAHMNSICEISDPQEVAELIGRVEEEKGGSLSGTFWTLYSREKQQYDQAASSDEVAATADALDADDGELSETREELSGLMEKVRIVSRQFRRA